MKWYRGRGGVPFYGYDTGEQSEMTLSEVLEYILEQIETIEQLITDMKEGSNE